MSPPERYFVLHVQLSLLYTDVKDCTIVHYVNWWQIITLCFNGINERRVLFLSNLSVDASFDYTSLMMTNQNIGRTLFQF